MKKLLFIILLALSFVIVPLSVQAIVTYNCNGLTGGTQRDLDYLGVADLNDGDRAIVFTSDKIYFFRFDADGTTAENVSTHPFNIRPDDYSSAGVWDEQELVDDAIDAAMLAAGSVGTSEIATDGVDAAELVSDLEIKGWIQFNGTGTIAIQDSYNVSGITDNGVGDYTVTWDTDFGNDDYAATVATDEYFAAIPGGNFATTSLQIVIKDGNKDVVDSAMITCISIGDQ